MAIAPLRRKFRGAALKDIETPLAWSKPISTPFALMRKPLFGNGYLAGEFPDGITTVEGAPVAATVRVMVRKPGDLADGFVVIETQSAADGTWRVDGLNPALRYDVVGRKAGFNDVIMANVSPEVV